MEPSKSSAAPHIGISINRDQQASEAFRKAALKTSISCVEGGYLFDRLLANSIGAACQRYAVSSGGVGGVSQAAPRWIA